MRCHICKRCCSSTISMSSILKLPFAVRTAAGIFILYTKWIGPNAFVRIRQYAHSWSCSGSGSTVRTSGLFRQDFKEIRLYCEEASSSVDKGTFLHEWLKWNVSLVVLYDSVHGQNEDDHRVLYSEKLIEVFRKYFSFLYLASKYDSVMIWEWKW